MDGVGTVTVPVNVGDASGAFAARSETRFTTPDSGKPVAFVSVPLAGVPRTGAVITGDVSVLFVSVWATLSRTIPPSKNHFDTPSECKIRRVYGAFITSVVAPEIVSAPARVIVSVFVALHEPEPSSMSNRQPAGTVFAAGSVTTRAAVSDA